jgi:cytidylate kinase
MALDIIIAIDGHSSCGKSTIAKSIAREYNIRYIDTGAMYRAITLFCLSNNIVNDGKVDIPKLESQLDMINVSFRFNPILHKSTTILNGKDVEKDIRSHNISNLVSIISQIKIVREKLVLLQREIGKSKGVVMDGRDIGTKVFPNAELKFFITAKSEIRAKRRFKEIDSSVISYQQVLDDLIKRDKRDTNRKINPLKMADDAVLVDNSYLMKKEQDELIFKIIREKIGSYN